MCEGIVAGVAGGAVNHGLSAATTKLGLNKRKDPKLVLVRIPGAVMGQQQIFNRQRTNMQPTKGASRCLFHLETPIYINLPPCLYKPYLYKDRQQAT